MFNPKMDPDLVAERCVGEEDDVGLKERASNQGLRLDSVTEGSQARSRIWTIKLIDARPCNAPLSEKERTKVELS